MPVVIAVVMGWLLSGTAASAQSDSEDQDRSAQVAELLVLKCGECHGSQLEKPDGGFGYVDDLAQLVEDPEGLEYIIVGDAEGSFLFESVTLPPDDPEFMPPADSDVEPLTEAEVELLRQWIEGGGTVSEDATEAAGTFEAPPPSGTFVERLQDFLAQFHTASTHLPIGLVIAAFVAELLGMLTGGSPRMRYTARFCLALALIGGLYTATSGWWYADGKYAFREVTDPPGFPLERDEAGEPLSGNDLFWHRWIGVGATGWTLITWLFAMITHRVCYRDETRARAGGLLLAYRLMLFLLVAAMGFVGFLGGNLVFGADHYSGF